MTSFIDLMANDRWSDADITNRTEAMLRSQFSAQAEAILNRKVSGAILGQYELTAEELAEMAAFAAASLAARQEGAAARADMALLEQVFALEAAQARLARQMVAPVLDDSEEPQITNQDTVDQDGAERAAAQAVVDAASVDAKNLALRRAPAPEPTPEPTQEPQP